MPRQWTHLVMTGAAAAMLSGWLVVTAPAAVAEPADNDSGSAAFPSAASSPTAESPAKPDATLRPRRKSAGSGEPRPAVTGHADRGGQDAGVDQHRTARKPRGQSTIDDRIESATEPQAEQPDAEPITAAEPEADPASPVATHAAVTPVQTAAVAPTDIPEPGDRSGAAAEPEDARVLVTETEVAEMIPTRRPTLIDVIGAVVVDLLVGFIQVLDGPPALPPNSSVTVRTSTLTLPIGSGRSVQADWYFPDEIDDDTRFVYLQHGFLASGPMYSHTAARLAERTNAIVMAPSLTSNFFAPDAAWVGGTTMHRAVAELFTGDRAVLNESASEAAGYAITLPERFAFVGHSAGGTMVTSVAGYLVGSDAFDDLVGVVMLDGVEPAGSPVAGAALNKLRDGNDVPIYLISSERYAWSRDGDMADKLQLARPDRFTGVGLRGGLHIDYMEGGNPIVQFGEYVVAGFSSKRNIEAAAAITIGWVNDLFDGTADGVYGAPGESIEVPTASGIATAIVLPLGEPARPVWPVLLDAIVSALLDFLGRYLAVYEPLGAISAGYRLQPTG